MRQIFIRFILFFLLLIPFTAAIAATETYTIDPNHSYVLWHISHFGFSNPSGKWMVHGTLTLDADKPENSKVNITIPVADIVTGIPELDKHLKSKLFFDVAQFPTATFVSDKVILISKKSAKVKGILTLHGVSKPVTLSVKLNKMGENPISNKMSVGFSATTQIKRSDFNINALSPGLGNNIDLSIEVEAYKEKT
ncbi:hypothetical protein AYO45_03155 [Gammaproteobacteria bacterium SCGC AG-212-F23]|nr:hypothetical protein AYO45_03155 [Gammaproteobacteria bacterium SCGC AG-212-F23]